MKLGVLQGVNTFGGEAGCRFLELYPELFDEIVTFNTAEDALGFEDDRAGASCAPQQMTLTGFHAGTTAYIARPESSLYVLGEVLHGYHCSLLVKPGSKLEDVKRILGHTGSITQSQSWLDNNAPHAKVEIVTTSSMDAARMTAQGDGSIASIGTPGMAREFGLTELFKDVDGGSVGMYWAISPHPVFSESPDRVLVAGRFSDDGRLTDLVCGLSSAGYRLESITRLPSTKRIFEYDDVLRFKGTGALSAVKDVIGAVSGARLAGAFTIKDF